jgi:hypothetical protein
MFLPSAFLAGAPAYRAICEGRGFCWLRLFASLVLFAVAGGSQGQGEVDRVGHGGVLSFGEALSPLVEGKTLPYSKARHERTDGRRAPTRTQNTSRSGAPERSHPAQTQMARRLADLEKTMPGNVRMLNIQPFVTGKNQVVLSLQVGSEGPEPLAPKKMDREVMVEAALLPGQTEIFHLPDYRVYPVLLPAHQRKQIQLYSRILPKPPLVFPHQAAG